jgi:hypothetical protein
MSRLSLAISSRVTIFKGVLNQPRFGDSTFVCGGRKLMTLQLLGDCPISGFTTEIGWAMNQF